MKRPLVMVGLLYVCGLLLGVLWQPPVLLLFGFAFVSVFVALAVSRLRNFLLWPLLILTGWTHLVYHAAILSPQDVRTRLTDEPEQVVVRGKLCETPSQRLYIHDEQESWRTLARVNLATLKRGDDFQPASGQIIVVTKGQLPEEFFAGQEVEIAGIIAPPASPLAEGLFDYRTYLRRQGIYFQLKAQASGDWRLLSEKKTPPVSDRFLAWAQKTMARGLPGEDEPLRLLWAMTLGWRAGITDEVYEPFMQSGTMHIFAISGLHIALIAGILVALLRVVQVPRFWCGFVIIPLIWFYTAVTGWQPSAVRSTVMMSIVIGGWSLKRPSDLLNSLATAGFIILLADPQQLFQASFQLSFFVVLSIALFVPPLEKVRDRLLRTDPLLPRELIPRWRRWLNAPLRIVTTSLATSLAAWLGSWPLCALYFHLFSPVTLLANLLVVPLSSAALACNLGSLICGDWFPWATELFNHSGWFWMKLMVEISNAVIEFPGAFFYTASPKAADFVIYYGALLAVLSGVVFNRKWRVWTATGVVCVIVFYSWRWEVARTTTTLTVLPLNGGSAVHIHPGKRANDLLVDCGDTNSVEFITKPFLHSQGVNRLPRLALTQGDVRDNGGALLLGDLFSVEQVVTSPVRFRSAAYREVIAALEQTPERHRVVNIGDSIGALSMLHPDPADRFTQADDSALVLKGEFNGIRILLLSDLGRGGQEALLERMGDLRADIVVAGLPEQGEPLSYALLEAIRPQIIIVADSEFPASKRASAALKARLASGKIPVFYTREARAVKISARNNRWEVRPMNGGKLSGGVFNEK